MRALLVPLALPGMATIAVADSRAVTQGKNTVRSLIVDKTSWSRVNFNKVNERSFSDSEVTISGQGIVSKSDSERFDRRQESPLSHKDLK